MSRSGHYVLLGVLSVVTAVVIVGVVAYFTPLDEPSAVGEPTSSDESFATTSPSVVLPTVPVEISSEQLQAEAIGEVEALRTRFPRLPEALHVAAMAYAGFQQTAKADEIWQTCIGLERTYVGPRLGRAILMSERGNDAEAVEILQAALADGCSTPEVFYRLATAQSKLGDVEQAEATLRTALEAFPSVSELWLALGQTQNQRLQFEEAERSLRQAVNLGNESPSVFFALANACQRLGKQEDAAEYRQRFTALKKTSADATADTPFQEIYEQALRPLIASTFASAGAVYARQGDSARGEELFLRALAIAPDDTAVLQELAGLFRQQRRTADARVVQERLVALQPTNVVHQIDLASVCAEQGDLPTAEAALEKARELRPDLAVPYMGLAQLHMQMGQPEQARLFAEGAVRRQPTVPGYGILARICQELGDLEAAAAAREAAKKLAATDARPDTPAAPAAEAEKTRPR